MEKSEYYSVKVTNTYGEELNLTVHWDSDIYEWARMLKVVLEWLQFHPDNIKEVIHDEE